MTWSEGFCGSESAAAVNQTCSLQQAFLKECLTSALPWPPHIVSLEKLTVGHFPGDTVNRNLPANAGGMG